MKSQEDMPSLLHFDLSGLAALISAGLAILLWKDSRDTRQENKRIKKLESERNARIQLRKAMLMDAKHEWFIDSMESNINLVNTENMEIYKRTLKAFDYIYESEVAKIEADFQKKLADKSTVVKEAKKDDNSHLTKT